MDILEAIDSFVGIPKIQGLDLNQELFDRLVNFILNLNPEVLTDKQLEKVAEIIDDLRTEDELEEAKGDARPLAGKSSVDKKMYSRKYGRMNRVKIRKKARELKRSIEGRKRKRMGKINKKKGKTPTGRDEVNYRPTIGGQGGDRSK